MDYGFGNFQCMCPFGFAGRWCEAAGTPSGAGISWAEWNKPETSCDMTPSESGNTINDYCLGDVKLSCTSGQVTVMEYDSTLNQQWRNCSGAAVNTTTVSADMCYNWMDQEGKHRLVEASCTAPTNHCGASPCMNGGTCMSWPIGYHCWCPWGWGGDHCDMRQPTVTYYYGETCGAGAVTPGFRTYSQSQANWTCVFDYDNDYSSRFYCANDGMVHVDVYSTSDCTGTLLNSEWHTPGDCEGANGVSQIFHCAAAMASSSTGSNTGTTGTATATATGTASTAEGNTTSTSESGAGGSSTGDNLEAGAMSVRAGGLVVAVIAALFAALML